MTPECPGVAPQDGRLSRVYFLKKPRAMERKWENTEKRASCSRAFGALPLWPYATAIARGRLLSRSVPVRAPNRHHLLSLDFFPELHRWARKCSLAFSMSCPLISSRQFPL